MHLVDAGGSYKLAIRGTSIVVADGSVKSSAPMGVTNSPTALSLL